MTSQQIRKQFLDFFIERHGHTFVPSSSVVPHDDPTLLFTNAGMNQFKPIFLGQERRPYVRAVNSQKCIRAGGKHNDLDDVGRSRRHHTFFEMLGNWSFGDYFKRGAIEMAWELLTKVWKLDPSRLHVSCYEGNPSAQIPRDTEAADLWKRVAGLDDAHIHFFGKDNFWEMGETGPCGPCTEIYIDRTPDKSGGPAVNGDDPRVMEIWNLVFIQYNRDASGHLTTLPAQHVDTGMGFERICQVLQDKQDNYAIDLWTPLFDRIAKLSGRRYTGSFTRTNAPDPVAEAANEQLRHDIAFRVVADHLRCLTFALTDGATPSNEGRGYVLRRILRRAVRFGKQQLGLGEPFLHQLVPVVVESMGDAFPELKRDPDHVAQIVREEEISFGKTLDRGIQLFEDAAAVGKIAADAAFKLHDTYGFPIDLTRIMAEERALPIDLPGYERLMEEARQRARGAGKDAEHGLFQLPPDKLARLAEAGVTATDDVPKFSPAPLAATVRAIWTGQRLALSPSDAVGDEQLAIVLDKTNFYAEMGGQIGDSGTIESSTGDRFDVATTRAVGGYVLHVGTYRSGRLSVGQAVTATVGPGRQNTEKNHTATHLANWALREVLGDGVQQKGSLVDSEKLRFDFSQPAAMNDEQIDRVQALVDKSIESNLPVHTSVVPQGQAMAINGLRAVFGEKYPPMVRVVSIGAPVSELLADPANPRWRQFSVEFCGGTHLASSGLAGAFVLMSEESVSKGIRRIVAHTGDAARTAKAAGEQLESLLARGKTMNDSDLPEIVAMIQRDLAGSIPIRSRRRAQAALAEFAARIKASKNAAQSPGLSEFDAAAVASRLIGAAGSLGDASLVIGDIPGATDEQLRQTIDLIRKKVASYGILLAGANEKTVSFVAVVSDDVIARGLRAGDWVREAAKAAGGGGGGRPQMAQAGGKDPAKTPDALAAALAYAKRALG